VRRLTPIIDDDRRKNLAGLLISLTMLIETPGGFDYTGAAGRVWIRVEPLADMDSMLVGFK